MKPATRSSYRQSVQAALEFVVANLDEALDLARLAAIAGLSPFHFHRVFKGMTGETPLELVRRLRLERAAARLVGTDLGITRLAFEAGFETHEAFSRAFRLAYGTSPTGFRRRRHPRYQIAASCGVHYLAAGPVAAFVPRDTGGGAMEVEIRESSSRRVATVRHLGPYNQISRAFARLGAIGGPAGLFRHPEAAMIALYHDDPETTAPEVLRSDAGVIVPDAVPLPPGLDEQRIPAGRFATVLHRGPYQLLGDVWARFLGEWLPASGHRIGAAPSFELYRNDPTMTPEQRLETEIWISLA
jgi:AraC family transcriptional regulator